MLFPFHNHNARTAAATIYSSPLSSFSYFPSPQDTQNFFHSVSSSFYSLLGFAIMNCFGSLAVSTHTFHVVHPLRTVFVGIFHYDCYFFDLYCMRVVCLDVLTTGLAAGNNSGI